ncbi:VOC family protein [Nocardioides sp. Soil805]|uniref:VOC family protein n=1 Tax=Nocardioides sp. Soil805 TaxID=1736416 RepID=UPI0007026E15|nr:VOC family protein [Nocardioides sp. Soil805]KRF30697.1 glyoxalase [Nocardioides sp. Soil805]
MSRTIQVTYDAHDPRSLGLFWCAALDYAVDPPPGGEIGGPEETVAAWMDFLRSAGVPEELHNSAFALVDPTGAGPRLFLQQVPEPKTAKNRVHLDVRAAPGLTGDERMAALEAECERLVGLGATRQRRVEPDGGMNAGHIVMTDPEGNEFCLD